MTKAQKTAAAVVLPLLALGAALWALVWSQSGRYTVLDHVFRPAALSALLFPAGLYLLLAAAWIALARREARLLGRDPGSGTAAAPTSMLASVVPASVASGTSATNGGVSVSCCRIVPSARTI